LRRSGRRRPKGGSFLRVGTDKNMMAGGEGGGAIAGDAVVTGEGEMRSLALTPTWSVATVLTLLVAGSLLIERSIHCLSNVSAYLPLSFS
jgi:hypothetical protein